LRLVTLYKESASTDVQGCLTRSCIGYQICVTQGGIGKLMCEEEAAVAAL